MGHVVAKEFKTVNRVMRVGTPVHPDEYLEPHSFDVMKARGFIKEVERAPTALELEDAAEEAARIEVLSRSE